MYNQDTIKECKLSLYTDNIHGVTLNEDGISNIAIETKWRLENEVFRGEDRIYKLNNLVKSIKKSGAKKKYDCIIDLCCGSGGKTLAIGSLMKNTGRIYAIDISIKKSNFYAGNHTKVKNIVL